MSTDGTKVSAIWNQQSPSNKIQSASATVTGNTPAWGAIADVATGNAANPKIAISADGSKATAVWYVGSSGMPGYPVRAQSATINGSDTQSWGSATDLSSCAYNAQGQQVAASSDGTVVRAVWFCQSGSSATRVIQTKAASVNGTTATWDNTAVDLSDSAQTAQTPQIGMSADGANATAIWQRSNGTNTIVQSSSFGEPPQAPTISSSASTSGTQGSALSFTVTTTGTPTVNSIAASTGVGQTGLPPGVTLSYTSGSSATISGTPTQSGTFTATITASNGVNPDATQTFTVTVTATPVEPNPTPNTNASSGSYVGANLAGANFAGMNLAGANFTGADLQGANLRGANLTGATFVGANLQGAQFDGTTENTVAPRGDNQTRPTIYRGATLTSANLNNANLRGANLRGAVMYRATLKKANLTRATLVGAYAVKADFRKASLKRSNLNWANLMKAKLAGTNMSGTKTTGTKY